MEATNLKKTNLLINVSKKNKPSIACFYIKKVKRDCQE